MPRQSTPLRAQRSRIWLALAATAVSHPLLAHEIEEIEVSGHRVNLIGESVSASEGVVSQRDIETRALLRSGEVLELIPGMVVTQHSGTGKANQYFLRGFNLDHGTDFASFYDDMPINMRSHGHGQGYTDLNFMIPELVSSLRYQKGPYYADVGDFSGAGAGFISSKSGFNEGQLKLTAGSDEYYRLFAGDSFHAGETELMWGFEANGYQGPWTDIDEDLEKYNGQIKATRALADGTLTWSLMGYSNKWNSADQIPARAVQSGIIDELGSIDTTTGGESSRYSANIKWQNEHWLASAYAIDYDLALWSNFTYFLDDPVNGDQFEQVDERQIYGGKLQYQHDLTVGSLAVHNRYGVETRIDDIAEVGLFHTQARQRLGTVRRDKITESSIAAYMDSEINWSERFKTVLGWRYDFYDFDVNDLAGVNNAGVDLTRNSGQADDGIASVKASAVYRLTDNWEGYLSAGTGFHSNDARGTTIRLDPADGSAVDTVDPLVRSFGSELGLRANFNERINVSAALWYLELDSELLFVGDAGNTEASDKTERTGLELTGYYRLNDNWTLDLEYAYTHARFVNEQPGRHVPGAVEDVLQLGVSADYASGVFGSLRLRYFGPRPLVETGDVNSDASTLLNAKLGYRFKPLTVSLDVLNLLDSNDHDIDYYYASQLAGEAAAVEDVHYHPLEPRSFRVTLEMAF